MNSFIDQEAWERRGANDARIAALETTVAAMAKFIKATSAGRLIQCGTNVVTTDGGGGAGVVYPTAFSVEPAVVLCNGDGGAGDDWMMSVEDGHASTSPTGFWFITTNSTGARVTAALVRVNWIAFGAA